MDWSISLRSRAALGGDRRAGRCGPAAGRALAYRPHARAAAAGAVACRSLLAALANPTIRNEEREPLTDIAVAVIDRSLSQENGERIARTNEAEAALKAGRRAAAQHRTPHRRGEVRHQRRGRRHARLRGAEPALADIPPERFAGAVMITDGQIHDAPAGCRRRPTSAARVHGLITGSKSETRPQGGDREGAALRHGRQGTDHRLPRRGGERPRPAGERDGLGRPRRADDHRGHAGPDRRGAGADRPWRPEHRGDRQPRRSTARSPPRTTAP